jgi:pheromone a factor receptor
MPDLIHSNYWRLVALASVDYIFTIPSGQLGISLNASWGHVSPWVSWDDTHRGYSRVFQYPRILMDPVQVLLLELSRWIPTFCAFAFFGFFGFADEAKEELPPSGFHLGQTSWMHRVHRE